MNNKQVNTPSAEGIAAAARTATKSQNLPPVMSWNPPFCGDLDIRIARNGTWFYLGTPIGRFELVKLFSSILKVEDGKYFLVTPAEKVGIKVDDAPFIAVDFNEIEIRGEKALKFETHKCVCRLHPTSVRRKIITKSKAQQCCDMLRTFSNTFFHHKLLRFAKP